jgi:hypothetical protein
MKKKNPNLGGAIFVFVLIRIGVLAQNNLSHRICPIGGFAFL